MLTGRINVEMRLSENLVRFCLSLSAMGWRGSGRADRNTITERDGGRGSGRADRDTTRLRRSFALPDCAITGSDGASPSRIALSRAQAELRSPGLLCHWLRRSFAHPIESTTRERIALFDKVVAVPFSIRFDHLLSLMFSLLRCTRIGLAFDQISMRREELQTVTLKLL